MPRQLCIVVQEHELLYVKATCLQEHDILYVKVHGCQAFHLLALVLVGMMQQTGKHMSRVMKGKGQVEASATRLGKCVAGSWVNCTSAGMMSGKHWHWRAHAAGGWAVGKGCCVSRRGGV